MLWVKGHYKCLIPSFRGSTVGPRAERVRPRHHLSMRRQFSNIGKERTRD